jgi:hypothetical protein
LGERLFEGVIYNEKSRCPKAAAPPKTELISTEIKRPGGP